MAGTQTAAELVPERGGLPKLREAAAACTACDLYRNATQTVFGEGTRNAEIMFVGEQPGDREDIEGEPFVGPAGRVLDEALEAAGIERQLAYVTNVVKHFKFTERGKRRIHRKPNMAEIRACRPWLDAEIATVAPKTIVCLGATAAQAIIGRDFKVSRDRMVWVDSDLADYVSGTVHPSSILRVPDEAARRAARDEFV